MESKELARVLLLDPPVSDIQIDPRKYKLLARLFFYWREISNISQSHLLLALINRIYDISNVNNYSDLDAQHLMSLRGEKMVHDIKYAFPYKSILLDGKVFGEVIRLEDGQYFFYGFDSEIIELLTLQNHEDILNFRSKLSESLDSRDIGFTVPMMIDESNIENFISQGEYRDSKERFYGKSIKAKAFARLSANSAGRVFGPVQIIYPQ